MKRKPTYVTNYPDFMQLKIVEFIYNFDINSTLRSRFACS